MTTLSPELTNIVLGALVAAAIATFGYLGKLVVGAWQAWRTARRERLTRLLSLDALLNADGLTFAAQLDLRRRLSAMLRDRLPQASTAGGDELFFSTWFPQFRPEEADLHRVIRGYTEFGLRPLNEQLLDWVRTDTVERTSTRKEGPQADLAAELQRLEAHLILWLAKCEVWLTDQPSHALVYLADEQAHGAGFPDGLEPALARVISARGATAIPRTR